MVTVFSNGSVLVSLRGGGEVSIPHSSVIQCRTIKEMVDACGETLQFGGAFSLDVDDQTFQMVVEFCEHRARNPLTVEEKDEQLRPPMKIDDPWHISDWEWDFVRNGEREPSLSVLYSLAKAANYLCCKELLYLAAKAIANKIRGKECKEVVRILGGNAEEFTPEAEAAVRNEHPWVEERFSLSYE
jgi:hypothetical protein